MLGKLICLFRPHDWRLRFYLDNQSFFHRVCNRCGRFQRGAGHNYWVTLERG